MTVSRAHWTARKVRYSQCLLTKQAMCLLEGRKQARWRRRQMSQEQGSGNQTMRRAIQKQDYWKGYLICLMVYLFGSIYLPRLMG